MLTMRSSADDVQMTYVPGDDVGTTYTPADDVWMTSGRHADDICHLPAEISNQVSLSCHPHIVCTRLQFPDNFQSKSREQLS